MTKEEKLKKLKKLADAMYYAAQYLTTDASRLHKAMDEYHKFIIHEWREEPVSYNLKEAIENYCLKHGYIRKQEVGYTMQEQITDIATHFYNLGKQQKEPVSEEFERVVLEECSKLLKGETVIIDGYEYVVFSDAEECFKAGAKWQKQQDQSTIELVEDHAMLKKMNYE
jgi:hypothetical protein